MYKIRFLSNYKVFFNWNRKLFSHYFQVLPYVWLNMQNGIPQNKKRIEKIPDCEFLWLIYSIIYKVIFLFFHLGGTFHLESFDLTSSNMLSSCDWNRNMIGRNLPLDNGVLHILVLSYGFELRLCKKKMWNEMKRNIPLVRKLLQCIDRC